MAAEALENAKREAAARKAELEKLEVERQEIFKELDAGKLEDGHLLSATSLAATWGLANEDVSKAGLSHELEQMFALYESCRQKAATYKGAQATTAQVTHPAQDKEGMEVDEFDEVGFDNFVCGILGPDAAPSGEPLQPQQAEERAAKTQKLREVWKPPAKKQSSKEAKTQRSLERTQR